MTDDLAIRGDFDQRVDMIEAGYEFLLAYAAQGRQTDRGAGPDRSVRNYLENMATALDGFAAATRRCAELGDANLTTDCVAFFDALERDANTARATIRLVLAQDDIGSQLVDNLNASIHLRALLTDIFVVDEALKPKPRG